MRASPPVVSSAPTGLQQVETAAENFANNTLLKFIWAQLIISQPWLNIPVVGYVLNWLFMYLGGTLDTDVIVAIGNEYLNISTAAQAAQETTEGTALATTIDNPSATPAQIAAAQQAFEASLANLVHFNNKRRTKPKSLR